MAERKGILIHKRISELCSQRGITIATMCDATGVSQNTMSGLKHDKKRNGLGAKNANSIASYFGVPVSYVICETDEIEEDIKKSSTSNEVLDDVTAEILERLSRMSSAEKNRALGYLDSLLASQENDGGFLK